MFYTTLNVYRGHKLVKRPDTPNLYIYWYGSSTGRIRRRTTGTSDPAEGLRRLTAFVDARLNAGVAGDDRPLLDLLCDYVEHGLDGKPGQEPGQNALKHWAAFCNWTDLLYVDELTYDAQEQYVQWRRASRTKLGKPLSDGSLIRELGVMRSALEYSRKRGFIKELPPKFSLPEPPPRDRFLTQDEYHRLLKETEQTPHLWRFVVFAVLTLQRPTAVLQLHESQVDFARQRINFSKPGEIATKKRRPVVRIAKTLENPLREAIRASTTGFLIEWNGLPVKCLRTAFKKACCRARIHDATPYTLRHTGATWLAASGVPMRQIAGMLGHSEISTTERYAKHSPDFLEDAADALDQVFDPSEVANSAYKQTEEPPTIELPSSPTPLLISAA